MLVFATHPSWGGFVFAFVLLGCGSGGTGGQLAQIGDDCAQDSDCASKLCDNNGSCAAPVATLDGKKCAADSDCPKGDSCDSTTHQCFSPAKDGTGSKSCTTDADCNGDETCGSNHLCQG
jgi:Cys-rich repeat protein